MGLLQHGTSHRCQVITTPRLAGAPHRSTTMKHHGVMTDQALRALRLRNEARVRARIEQMGSRWLLHPANGSPRQAGRK